jgi:poly [ADP-ribose] polymerase
MEFKSRKVLDISNDGFSETTKFTVLHCTNFSGNNNKFYCIEIQKNPKTGCYRLFSHYGRLGYTNIYDVREEENGKCVTDASTIEQEFDRIIKKKIKGKTIKEEDGSTHHEKYEQVDVFSPTVGSENIRGKSSKTVEVKLAKKDIVSLPSYSHPEVSRVLKQIIDENIHNISSMTSLKLTSNGFETPLGPVTKEHVLKSREPLNILKSLIINEKLDPDNKLVIESNNKFFSLIPHSLGHKIKQDDWILDEKKLFEEFELLDNLESAVQMGSALKNVSQQKNALGSDIELVEDDRKIKTITQYVETSKAQNHRGLDVWKYKVKTIFKIRIPHERTKFDDVSSKYGNIKELFHGSRNCNILSIVKNGLMIPPYNAAGVTGRLFGNAVYGANNSSKSLNYSIGWWARSKNKNDNAFLFLAMFAMGKEYITKTQIQKPPSGYDSVWAQQGVSVKNDEFMVYKPEQTSITYLIEMV